MTLTRYSDWQRLWRGLGLVLSAAFACGADPPPLVLGPASAHIEPSAVQVATALASTEWSGTASDCDGVFIAPRRHCFKAQSPVDRSRSSVPLHQPNVLVLAKRSSFGLDRKIIERCVVTEEQTVLPVDGLELEVLLAPGVVPEVVRADERLGTELIACTAEVVRASYGASQTPKSITIVFFPGDIEDDGRTQLDAVTAPGIIVEFQKVDAPLTRASALRLLRANAEAMLTCLSAYKEKGRVSLVVEMTFGRDGSANNVKSSSVDPEAADLTKCIVGVHYGMYSTVFAEDGTTTLKVMYWLRGSPNRL